MTVTEKEFEHIISENKGRLRHLCRVYANRPGDEKDLYQEILIQIWRSLPSFKGNARINTWIYRLAINTAISFVRKKKTRKNYYDAFKEEQETRKANVNRGLKPSSESSPKVDKLYNAISMLNPSEKAIITMYLEDFSYSEIAFVTDISENYVGVKLHRIKKKLNQIIGGEHGT